MYVYNRKSLFHHVLLSTHGHKYIQELKESSNDLSCIAATLYKMSYSTITRIIIKKEEDFRFCFPRNVKLSTYIFFSKYKNVDLIFVTMLRGAQFQGRPCCQNHFLTIIYTRTIAGNQESRTMDHYQQIPVESSILHTVCSPVF